MNSKVYWLWFGERVLTSVLMDDRDWTDTEVRDEAIKREIEFPLGHMLPHESPADFRAMLAHASVRTYLVTD